MKKWLVLVGLSIVFLAACDQQTSREQPTSFGGITPGQTTREQLKSLVKNPDQVGAEAYAYALELKQPDGISVVALLRNDVVYKVEVSLFLSSFSSGPLKELKAALIEKYGQPGVKVGGIRKVTCRNKLGGSFDRLEGKEELRWPVKDGVQGAILRRAGECSEDISEEYLLRHVATVKAIENADLERALKRAEEQKRKLGGAY